ncbi:MAG: BON domain-containing protein [Armatimonadota bacterium]|nr:BON domain-containing protein [Armatimonadota bacterium]
MPAEDVQMTRLVQREIGRRYIDSRQLDVRVIHGVVYIRGTVRKIRGHDVSLEAEMEIIRRILRSKPGIRDVIMDVTYR